MQQTPPVTRGFVVCGDQPVEAIMSCGGCNARADAIRAGALAIASGDRAELDRQMKAFTASAKDDAVKIKQSASQGITRALARLGSRRG